MPDRQNNRTEGYWTVRILVESQLDTWFGDYLGGVQLWQRTDGTTLLRGSLPDVAGVYGLILQLRDFAVVPIEIRARREHPGD